MNFTRYFVDLNGIPLILDDLRSALKLSDSSIASMVRVSVSRLSMDPEQDGELSGLVLRVS